MYDWDFRLVWHYRWVFLQGGWITLELSFLAIVLGTAIGTLLGLGRASRFLWMRLPISLYVELFLAFPVLVLLIWIYYCGPILFNVHLSSFWTAVVALTLSLSAFVAEIVRSGLKAVPKGQIEAARALGMTQIQALIYIEVPQALRVVMPPLLGMYISTLKLSSLASVIAVYELLHSAQNLITTTFRPLEVYTVVAAVYLIMLLPLILITRRIESIKGWRLS